MKKKLIIDLIKYILINKKLLIFNYYFYIKIK